jgi:hypothetical protein
MQQSTILLNSDEFWLQFNSKVLVDAGSRKNNARSMKKFAEKWREKVCEICNFDLDLR